MERQFKPLTYKFEKDYLWDLFCKLKADAEGDFYERDSICLEPYQVLCSRVNLSRVWNMRVSLTYARYRALLDYRLLLRPRHEHHKSGTNVCVCYINKQVTEEEFKNYKYEKNK